MGVVHRKSYMGRRAGRRGGGHTLIVALAVLVGVGLIANGVTWFLYKDKTLPRTQLGSVQFGSVAFTDVSSRLQQAPPLPQEITLKTPGSSATVQVATLGVRVDAPATEAALRQTKTAWPLLRLVRPAKVDLSIQTDESVFNRQVSELVNKLEVQPLPERVVAQDDRFEIAPPRPGYTLTPSFASEVRAAVTVAGHDGSVTSEERAPPASTMDVESEKQRLQSQLGARLTLNSSDKKITPSAKDKLSWYVQDGQTMSISPERIQAHIKRLTQNQAANSGDIAMAVRYALEQRKNADLTIARQGALKLAYCTAVRGVADKHLRVFTGRVAVILADSRGWNADGNVAFERVESGCGFTIWLAAPSTMTGFSSICDAYYSCRAGNNVVINFDRWTKATPPWKDAGKTIQEYEALVVNHEVGHQLGFGHPSCPSAGQPAPVMMQQSIELGGCTFNAWPT